jgi:large conductance mechanosensitive channel protein
VIGEFRKFILRGNLVDLAVAVVIGAAFGAVVNSLVRDLVTPLVAAIGGKQDVDRETRECPECLSGIPLGARRCAFCTAVVAVA